MRETISLALRLFLFALIAAVALAATNEITKGPIAQQALAKANAAREQVLPGADEYDELPIERAEDYPGIEALHRAVKDGETVGYTFLVRATGYKGAIMLTVAVNQSGSINSVVVNSQSETAGLGSKVANPDFLDQFQGKAADPGKISGEVDAITGATVSSKATISGVEQTLRYARDVLGLPAQAGEVVTGESDGAYRALEDKTGAKALKPLSAFASIGFPDIEQVYSAEYEGQLGYLFQMKDAEVILSDEGGLLSPYKADDPDVKSAMDYFDKYLKRGGMGA